MTNKVTAIVGRHWKTLLGLNLIILAATVGSIAFAKRAWTAKAQLILPSTTSNLDANLGTLGSLSNGETGFSNQVSPLKVQSSILLSDDLLKRVLAKDPEKEQFGLGRYRGLFKVTPQEQSTIISLEVNGSSPELAKQRTTALTQAYVQRLNELRRDNGAAREQFSRSELERSRRNLAQAQSALASFKRTSGLVNGDEQTKGIVSTISSLTAAQAQAQAQAQSAAARTQALAARLSQTPDQAIRSLRLGENQSYQFTRQKLSEVEAQLVQARAQFKDNHPRVQGLISQETALRAQLAQYVAQAAANVPGVDTTVGDSDGRVALIQQLVLAESDSRAQRRQAEQLERQVNQLSKTLKSIPNNQARVLELQRQYDITEGVYKGLVAQVQQASVDAFNTYPNVQVLDSPTVDPNPSSPKEAHAVLGGLLASLFGSLALALLLEGRNPLLSPKDLQGTEFPMVVRLPRLKRPGLGLEIDADTEVEFQRLGSATSLLSLDNHRLMITSSTAGEGKTTVTLGLAVALADLGFQVLLIDGDFRQAQLSRTLGYAERADTDQAAIPLRPGLDLVPTSPKQGKVVELVARGRFERYLSGWQSKGNYDYILIDSAPVNLTSETALMATAAHNVLFVVRPGTSNRNAVNQSLEQLAHHNAEIAGLVINGVEMATEAYRYRRNGSTVNP
ncbi:tyrosine-protein kinase domain-containing protein [Leptolyngbya sp. FACHB-261]|uniref:GumC family protein n=1 Tax=Leptolyngbya sp. FACHB-261 TaxID=2692806 RepID=UPI00168976C2|nr:tyrosine-protein kinase domain-containing protein [Leptolyngbya sp. FACHB-261]MBD2105036.1 P-loop NTPase [Leptolyngbya sp. FACHB-261]